MCSSDLAVEVCVDDENAVVVKVLNGPEGEEWFTAPKHKKNPDVGIKVVLRMNEIIIDQADARAIGDGEECTLMGWGNAIFKNIVKIPCDDDEAFEAREMVVGAEETGDALPEALRSSFAGGGVVDAERARAEAVRSLGERGKSLTAEAIVKTTEGGSTETFALVRPSAANAWRGVYLYLDEVGMLKNLPPNRRANRLAMECGFDGVQFYGDMYIGRVQTKPEPMRSVDFELSDLDSSAPDRKSVV